MLHRSWAFLKPISRLLLGDGKRSAVSGADERPGDLATGEMAGDGGAIAGVGGIGQRQADRPAGIDGTGEVQCDGTAVALHRAASR